MPTFKLNIFWLFLLIKENYDQGFDAEVNGPLERYLGHDEILSPADLRDTYRGVYPTPRRMREVRVRPRV